MAVLAALTLAAAAATLQATPLVSDDLTVNPAQIADPGLVNAWGLASSPNTAFWVSSNGAGTSTIYSVNPATQATAKLGLTVAIPGAGNVTGQVFNGGGGFNGDRFLFVSEDGTVSGWRPALGVGAETLQTGLPANIYKGVALGSTGGHDYLYAANFGTGTIDVLGGDAGAPALSGHFTDPALPANFVPFNVQRLDTHLYVAYALRAPGADDETAGPGLGIVDRYDLQGNLVDRVATAGTLNAPWALAIAPSSFGALAGSLVVGNFGDGRINLYDRTTHAFLGQVQGPGGTPLTIDGLWALAPGSGGQFSGSTELLYYTAGPGDEKHGVFGVLTAVPEPSTAALWLAGLVAGGALAWRRRQTEAA